VTNGWESNPVSLDPESGIWLFITYAICVALLVLFVCVCVMVPQWNSWWLSLYAVCCLFAIVLPAGWMAFDNAKTTTDFFRLGVDRYWVITPLQCMLDFQWRHCCWWDNERRRWRWHGTWAHISSLFQDVCTQESCSCLTTRLLRNLQSESKIIIYFSVKLITVYCLALIGFVELMCR